MSTVQSGKTVVDGLLLSLDAANPQSYNPQEPSRWYDISGNGNHFVLYNSPTFDNTGSVLSVNFDGIDDYGYWIGPFGYNTNKDIIKNRFITTGTNLNTSPFDDRTIEIWFRSNGTNCCTAPPYNWGGLFGESANSSGLIYLDPAGVSNPGNLIRWRWDDSTAVWTQKKIETGEWLQLVVCLRNSYYYTYYVNGRLDTVEQRSSDLSSPGNTTWYLGKEARFNYMMACNVAILRMYNRVLSASEILQNYMANKSRFPGIDPPTPVVLNGLVMWLDAGNTASYPGSGTAWNDISSNGNNGTLFNGVTFDSGNGGSLVFDGSNDYFRSSTNGLTIGANLLHSLEMWVNFTTITGSRWWLAVIGQFTTGANHWIGNTATANQFGAWNGGQVSANLLGANQWLHLVTTFDGTTIRIYVNSVFGSSNTTSFNFTNTDFTIALNGQGENYFNGKVAIARIYNKTLSADEVLQNYNANKSRFGL